MNINVFSLRKCSPFKLYKMKKLELKHLAPYLPYRLKIQVEWLLELNDLILIQTDGVNCDLYDNTVNSKFHTALKYIKPILRPLEDLFFNLNIENESQKPFEYLEDFADTESERMFLDVIEYKETKFILEKIQYAPFSFIQKLFEWHFDVFGLINKGLAIDINTL